MPGTASRLAARRSLASSVAGQHARSAWDEEGMQLIPDSRATEMLNSSHAIDVFQEDDGLTLT